MARYEMRGKLAPESSSDNSNSLLGSPRESSIYSSSTGSKDSTKTRGKMSTRSYFKQYDGYDGAPSSTTGDVNEEEGEEMDESIPTSSSNDESFFDEREPEHIVSELEAIGIMTVLEETVDQLHILGLANRESSVQPEMVYCSLDEKFRNETAKAKIIDIDTDKLIAEKLATSNMVKVQRDRAFAEKTLAQTLYELKYNGSFSVLVGMVAQEAYSKEEEMNLLKEERENSATVKDLLKKLKDDTEDNSLQLEDRDEVLAKMKDTYQDKFFGAKMKIKFVTMWEQARRQQHTYKYTAQQNGIQKELDDNNYSFDVEQRVHNEIEDYIRQTQTKLEAEIENWMEKYDQDIEQRDLELNYLKQERATHFKEFEDLALLYQHHKNEIDEYLVKREIREKQRALELKIYNMATRIQAWWRGIMVRHHLGPFRKKKGKKGKDKGKDKGKGNKK